VGPGVSRLQEDGPGVDVEGLVQFPLKTAGDGQVVQCVGQVGLEAERLPAAGLGLVRAAQQDEDVAQVAVMSGLSGLPAHRLPVMGQRFLGPALGREQVRQVAVKRDAVRVQLRGPAKGGHGLVRLPQFPAGDAELVVSLGEVRAKPHRLLQAGLCRGVIALGQKEVAQVVVGVGVVRLEA
jgi:hypothetical protein